MADSDGVVRATDKAIARRALISEEITGAALHQFQEPDRESRSPDNEGRRIEAIPGGYLVLRYVELARLKTRAEQQEATRRRVAKHRATKASANVTPSVTGVTDVTHSDADAKEEEEANTPPTPQRGLSVDSLASTIRTKLSCPQGIDTIKRHIKASVASGRLIEEIAEGLPDMNPGTDIWDMLKPTREAKAKAQIKRALAEEET